MTKEYNDSLNKSFIGFILKSIATVLAVAGLLLVTGIVTIGTKDSDHVREVYVDGVLTERTTWNEVEEVVAGIDLHINVEDSTTLWSK